MALKLSFVLKATYVIASSGCSLTEAIIFGSSFTWILIGTWTWRCRWWCRRFWFLRHKPFEFRTDFRFLKVLLVKCNLIYLWIVCIGKKNTTTQHQLLPCNDERSLCWRTIRFCPICIYLVRNVGMLDNVSMVDQYIYINVVRNSISRLSTENIAMHLRIYIS